MKQNIAVFFGGRSPEHDISVVTALQIMNALDSQRYQVIPVYIDINGLWFTGAPLRKRENYLPKPGLKGVTPVRLDFSHRAKPSLITESNGLFQKSQVIPFDVAMMAFHGSVGEDGCVQGLMETANVPYTGMRLLASTLFMDKIATKHLLTSLDVPVLPYAEIRRPVSGTYVDPTTISNLLAGLTPPYCVKPSHLGSSIGVGKANDANDVAALLPAIFAYDTVAIVEPFVPNMVEYNVSLARLGEKVITSAIERPKRVEELLNFKEKYLSGAGQKSGGKIPGESSEGMLSLTREINPKLPDGMEANIRKWGTIAFDKAYGTGVPRIDFISNESTGEVWLNEVNPCPGSFGYFLWEASKDNPILFSDLLDHLVDEAIAHHRSERLPDDPVPDAARILER